MIGLDATKFEKARKPFEAWLVERGSAIMGTTNPYEVMRFLSDSGIAVVYKDGNGRITSCINGADRAFAAIASETKT